MRKEPYKTGMIFKSKTHPQFDLIIDFVTYSRCSETDYEFNLFSIVCWANINRKAFEQFVEQKFGKNRETTYPYAYYGECTIKSMKQRLKKYNLEYVGMSDDEISIYHDDEGEYCSGFKHKHSELCY